ncbi:hypothetical protein AGR4A_Cc140002 [Agrobacterium tumefaciens str. B6]|uniref:Uncharacterized protein n=1 Tax=Agrobacterium tumefaciens str. B6 TaxID=1183423 RepID=A0A822UWB9_AGRTU|nr:hypothetical protein AGR4A_Cc140002 [Agrobacterium tumefaciens str. B6]
MELLFSALPLISLSFETKAPGSTTMGNPAHEPTLRRRTRMGLVAEVRFELTAFRL